MHSCGQCRLHVKIYYNVICTCYGGQKSIYYFGKEKHYRDRTRNPCMFEYELLIYTKQDATF